MTGSIPAFVFMDPDRRSDPVRKRKISYLHADPPLKEVIRRVMDHSEILVVKLSPMEDLTGLMKLSDGLYSIYVVSLFNEVREIMLDIRFKQSEYTGIRVVCLTKKGKLEWHIPPEASAEYGEVGGSAGKFFFEPDHAIIKSGYAGLYGREKSLTPLQTGIPYFTSEQLPENFAGRVFEIKEQFRFNPKNLRKLTKSKGVKKINLSARGVQFKVPDLLKQAGLSEGGDDYIFVYKDGSGKNMAVSCSPNEPIIELFENGI
jgi:hypothetical protein